MNDKQELKAIYDGANGFYKKAYFTKKEDLKNINFELFSYNSLVTKISYNKDTNTLELYLNKEEQDNTDFYSRTTLRHIKELIKQVVFDEVNAFCSMLVKDKQGLIQNYSASILCMANKSMLFEFARHDESI